MIMESKVNLELTVEQTQLARLALGIAVRDARISLEKCSNITKRYEIESLIQKYKDVERTMYEAQKEMLRKKGVNI